MTPFPATLRALAAATLLAAASAARAAEVVLEVPIPFDPAAVELVPGPGGAVATFPGGVLPHDRPGAPWMAVRPVRADVPAGSSLLGVEIDAATETVAEGVGLAPEQPAVDPSVPAPDPVPADPALYAEAAEWGAIDGAPVLQRGRGVAFVAFAYRPLRYDAAARSLSARAGATARIRLDVPDEAPAPAPASAEGAAAGTAGTVDYLIVTTDALEPAFRTLAEYRAIHDGVNFAVLTIEGIRTTYDGTKPNGGTDDQTRIRNCIKDYVENRGTRYVLLGGGQGQLPKRSAYAWATTGTTYHDLPCDLYFSCLEGTWDSNGDGHYGKDMKQGGSSSDAGTDIVPDVALGRVPADTLAAAQAYVAKVVSYEAEESDPETARYFLMLGAEMSPDNLRPLPSRANWPTAAEVWDDGLPEVDESTTRYVADGEIAMRRFWKEVVVDGAGGGCGMRPRFLLHNQSTEVSSGGNQYWSLLPYYVEEEMKAHRPRYTMCFSHGYTPNWSSSSSYSETTVQQGHQLTFASSGSAGSTQYGQSAADSHTGRSPIFVGLSCYTGAFDMDCFAEHMLFNPNAANLVQIACSRQSYYDYIQNERTGGMTIDHGRAFFDNVFNKGARRVGDAFAGMKADMAALCGSGFPNDWRFIQFDHNLLGDPMVATPTYESLLATPAIASARRVPDLLHAFGVTLSSLGRGNASVPVRIRYGTDPLLQGSALSAPVAATAAGTEVRVALSGLEEGATYYWQPVAEAPDGTRVYGSVSSFSVAYPVRLGAASATPAPGGASATLSVAVESVAAPPATLALYLDGAAAPEKTWTGVSGPGIYSHAVAVEPGSSHTFLFVATPASGAPAESGGSFATRVPVALGEAGALVRDNGSSAVLSVEILSIADPPATLELFVDGALARTWTGIAEPGAFSHAVAVSPGSNVVYRFVATPAAGAAAVADGSFVATIVEGWFDVRFADPGYAAGAGWTDVSRVTNPGGSWSLADARPLLADARGGEPRRVELGFTDGASYTPTAPSEDGADVTVEGRLRVSAGSALSPAGVGSLAGLAFLASGGAVVPHGLADGAWVALAPPPDGLEPESWHDWKVELDLRSGRAPRIRYSLDGAALAASGSDWIALAAAPVRVSSVTFAGDGAIADFKGVYTTTVIGEFERPELATRAADGVDPLAFGGSAAAPTFSTTIRNAAAGAWYTVYAAGSLSDPFLAVHSEQASEAGILVLTIDASAPTRFVRIGVGRIPVPDGTPLE